MRWIVRGLLAILLLVVATVAGLWAYMQRAAPQTDGELTLTGARTWYALRRDYGLSPEDTLRNVTEQLTALLDMSGPNAT